MMKMLEVSEVTKNFGGLRALSAVSFDIQEGEIFSLIGPNGAGKTTMFNVITGIYPATGGSILFKDLKLTKPHPVPWFPLVRRPLRPFEITRSGIARTFQNIRLFSNMTAIENVMVGVDAHGKTTVFGAMVRTLGQRREERMTVDRAHELLSFVGIERYANELSKNLAYGDQRRLEIARAMGTNPDLLMLDEPAAGMNPAEKAELMRLIQQIRDQGMTVLLIEHDMKVVMGISDHIVVLDFGEKIAEGRAQDVQRDPRVIEAYLGRGATGAASGDGGGAEGGEDSVDGGGQAPGDGEAGQER